MRWAVAVLMGGACLGSAGGCRTCDLVEAELRTKERLLREARDELCKAELFNEALVNELRCIRPQSHAPISPEQASQIYTLKEITLGRTTGGHDSDGIAGDEALHVLLEPRDPDGHAVKAPGAVRVEAAQVSPEGIKAPLCFWDVSPVELRRSWRSGLFSNGYDLILPWKVMPTSDKVRVTVRLSAADGRVFEADKDVAIRLGGEGVPKHGPVFGPEGIEIMPPPDALPAPRLAPVDQGPELQPATRTGLKPADWQRHPSSPVHLRRPEPFR
jgi:hypothetical protein